MIIKKTITIALLVLMGLSSTDAMQVACRNFGRGYPPFVRNHSDVRPDLREPIRQYISLYAGADKVIKTCVQGMITRKDPKLIIYGAEYVNLVRLVQLYFDPHCTTHSAIRNSTIKQLISDLKQAEMNIQMQMLNFDECLWNGTVLGDYPIIIDFDHPKFILASKSREEFNQTLATNSLYISLSSEAEDPTVIE